MRAADLKQRTAKPVQDGLELVFDPFRSANGLRLEKISPWFGAAPAEAESHHRENALDIGILHQDLLGLSRDVPGVLAATRPTGPGRR